MKDHPVARRILGCFPNAILVEIDHYKDVFCRTRQDYRLQKRSQGLILAKKRQNAVYEGAPVCQDFGNRHFYYTSLVMNCIYDCEYCYLQGMYPSANMVVFVNIEEVFGQVERLLERHPVYLCVSYDTDLLALEHILGYVKEWIGFAAGRPELTVEIRTKSANIKELDGIKPADNVILAWTLSPERIAEDFEQHTPSLEQRLRSIGKAMEKGFKVRLCFDPMIYCRDWKEQYREMFRTVFSSVPAGGLEDVSLGVFRVPQDYMKRMRKQAGHSPVIQFPFENDNGVYHYSSGLTGEMISFAYDLIKKEIPEEKIFVWDKALRGNEV